VRDWISSPAIRFVLLFGLWLGLFSLLFQIAAVDEWLVVPLTRGIAHVSNVGLHLIGFDTEVSGTVIQGSEGLAVNILKGCNGAYVMAIFAAAVLAFPAPWGFRLAGLAVGMPAVQIINLGRIISLYYIGVNHPALFEKFHYEVWQTIVILLSMALWLGWAEISSRVARG
jgi:exosortase H (IPTLxxWG-CTERM-specific)